MSNGKVNEIILDRAIEMYCQAREEVLFYRNKVPAEASILSREYVKKKLLAMENVKDYWVFSNDCMRYEDE